MKAKVGFRLMLCCHSGVKPLIILAGKRGAFLVPFNIFYYYFFLEGLGEENGIYNV